MFAPTETASFFLPGIVHQFGNLLLTVQGHALQVEPAGAEGPQKAILSAVQRGSASLQVVRAMMGEETGATGSAYELLMQLAELGRVPARECGLTLELRGEEPQIVTWVAAEPFVMALAEALRRWIRAVRTGSSGAVTMSMDHDEAGQARVRLGYEPGVGSLPFPMPSETVAKAVSGYAQKAGGVAIALDPKASDGRAGIELQFRSAAVMPGCEA